MMSIHVFQNGFNFGFDWTPEIRDFVFNTVKLGAGDLALR